MTKRAAAPPKTVINMRDIHCLRSRDNRELHRDLAEVWDQLGDLLQVESQVRGAGRLQGEAAKGTGAREQPAQTHVCRSVPGECRAQGCHRKKALRPAERREVVAHMVTQGGLPIQRACHVVGLGRATYYRPLVDWARRDAPVNAASTTLVAAKSCWGFWKRCDRLRLDDHGWNHKRLWRVYCQLRLNLPRWTKKRLPVRLRQPLVDEGVRERFGH